MSTPSPVRPQPVQLLRLRSGPGRIGLAATVLASSTASLDATIASVALPHIAEDFDAGLTSLQWVIAGYLLTLASLILLGGALGDRFGTRRVFLVGAAWFAIASLGCALAPSVGALVVARLLQGVGGALLTPTSLALTQSSFVPDDRGAAVGAWSGLGGIAGALGPLVGGWLVDGPGWRWAFLLNLPLLGAAMWAARALPDLEAGGVEDRAPGFDVAGAALATLSLGGLTWGLTEGAARGWSEPTIVGGLAVAVLGGIAFVAHERRSSDPLVPRFLFRSRTFTVLNVMTFALYATLGVAFFLIAYQLQVSAGWSALTAGSALLPATLIMLVGSARAGAVAVRIGPRLPLTVGPLLVAVAVVMLGGIDPDATWWPDVAVGSVVFGLGLVTFVAPLTATVMASVDDAHVSTASGVNNAVARTGGLLAVALIPSASGLTTAVGPAEITDAYGRAMWMAAGLAVLAAVIAAAGLTSRSRSEASARRYLCPVDGAPLQPDPRECPPVSSR